MKNINAPLLISGCALFFCIGTVFTDYMYKDIPKTSILTVRSSTENESLTRLEMCKGASRELVFHDAVIVNMATDLVDDYTARLRLKHIDPLPDRYQDIYNAMNRRDPILKTINNL